MAVVAGNMDTRSTDLQVDETSASFADAAKGFPADEARSSLADAAAVGGFGSDFDQPLAEALALFEKGYFGEAETFAMKAATVARTITASKVAEVSETVSPFERSLGQPPPAEVGDEDWKSALDLLAVAYEDAARTEQAESLYLRMLAWKEGVEQYRSGHFSVAAQLFKKSPDYRSVTDATWFLRGLRPDDGHAVSEVVGLLALGEQVAAKAAIAVWTLALRPKARPQITECGGLELLAKAVAYHSENAELQAAGCGALRLLCTGHHLAPRNRRALVERLGGADALANSMRCHPQDPEVQREACGALHVAANGHPAGARRIVDSDGMRLCLEAISGCPHDEAVGDAACRALAAMQCASQASSAMTDAAAEDFEAIMENKLRGERENCLVHCEEELRRYLVCDDRPVIQALLTACCIFLEDSSVRHRGLGLIEPVVACMQKFQGQPRVQAPACGVLWWLTVGHLSRDDAVALVASCGGIGALCQTMKDLPCHDELQRRALGALRNVCFGNDAYKTLAVRAGGIHVTLKAMQRYSRDVTLQEYAIGAMTSFCDTIGRATLCAKLGGIEAIIAAVRLHSSAGHIAELGCILLCMFCDDPQLRQHIMQAGAVSIAKALSRTGASEAQRWGCELLRDLSEN